MKTRKFGELRDALYADSPDSSSRVAEKVARLNEQLALADLRAHRSRTQAQLAQAIGTTQSAISRLERQPDLLISTLRDYVEATGGRLRLVVEYGDHEIDVDVPALHRPDNAHAEREFRVVWQNLQTRQFVHVGWLRVSSDRFTFTYTPEAELDLDFEPFAAFSELREEYESAELFPFFAERVVSAAQPGFDDLISALGLDRESATPVELLARSWGRSSHDTIQIVPEPIAHADGTVSRFFLVSGVSHVDENNPGKVSKLISKLKPGQELLLRDEPDNPVNSDALMIEADGQQVGWMPDYLLGAVRKAQSEATSVDVVVEHANGPATPWHLRLLCRLDLRVRQ
jgi:transcriptional regulator with XRE-family HTH domain